MSINPRTDIFLARALEAVEEAAEARSRVARAQWLKIAEAYRELAQPSVETILARGNQKSR
jgi:hypothetical protein